MTAIQRDEAPTVAPTTRGPKAENSNDDCRMPEPERKAFATLQAEFALLGHSLFRNCPVDRPGWFTVTRWGLARDLCTLDEVRGFLRQIGGAA
jgi:hypothetical protein